MKLWENFKEDICAVLNENFFEGMASLFGALLAILLIGFIIITIIEFLWLLFTTW
jgi:uncharacterized membrane protein